MLQLPISEIYPAVQGEGLHKNPAVFVRVWGCNLRCGWNKRKDGRTQCDTPYAVFEGKDILTDIGDIIKKIKKYSPKHVVFTGGEPTLLQFALLQIFKELPDYFIEVETNGTINILKEFAEKVHQFNISPKLKSSNQWNESGSQRINVKALQTFPQEKSIFKFVITSRKDISEIQEITRSLCIPIYLMPQGETRQQIIRNLPLVLNLCLQYGYGFTNRDHIIAYGKKRGV